MNITWRKYQNTVILNDIMEKKDQTSANLNYIAWEKYKIMKFRIILLDNLNAGFICYTHSGQKNCHPSFFSPFDPMYIYYLYSYSDCTMYMKTIQN